MLLSPSASRRLVRASALYDLFLTAAFATPWTFALVHGHLSALNVALGGAALPAFTPFHLLFACLMGSIVLVWSVLRILEPTHAPRAFRRQRTLPVFAVDGLVPVPDRRAGALAVRGARIGLGRGAMVAGGPPAAARLRHAGRATMGFLPAQAPC